MGHSRGATVLDDLPDSIVIEEILVRLPTRDVLRCRAVRTSWRSGTSTKEFILAHRRRQPSLPVIGVVDRNGYCHDSHLAIFRGTGAYPRCILRFGAKVGYRDMLKLEAACDGLLLVSSILLGSTTYDPGYLTLKRVYHVCNPATRQCASLRQLPSCMQTNISGFYCHQPSGEHRVLYWTCKYKNGGVDGDFETDFYVLTLGSGQQRRIPSLLLLEPQVPPSSCNNAPILHRGRLHWQIADSIMVFDTTVETFRLMRCPAQLGSRPWLLEMNGALTLCNTTDGVHIDVSVMQDYVAEIWAFKCRINLSTVAAPLSHGALSDLPKMVMLNEREFLIQLPRRLLHCDIDGNLFGNAAGDDDMWVTTHVLQESMIPLPFPVMQEQDGVNMEHPYILEL